MARIDESLTKKVAHLARLELSESEIQTFTQQLGDVVKYIEKINGVDTQGVQPMTHPLDISTPMRVDEVVPSPRDEEGKPKVLRDAPDVLYDGYKVPSIL